MRSGRVKGNKRQRDNFQRALRRRGNRQPQYGHRNPEARPGTPRLNRIGCQQHVLPRGGGAGARLTSCLAWQIVQPVAALCHRGDRSLCRVWRRRRTAVSFYFKRSWLFYTGLAPGIWCCGRAGEQEIKQGGFTNTIWEGPGLLGSPSANHPVFMQQGLFWVAASTKGRGRNFLSVQRLDTGRLQLVSTVLSSPPPTILMLPS